MGVVGLSPNDKGALLSLEMEAIGAKDGLRFTTNAAKHGALSQRAPAGRVDVVWTTTAAEGGRTGLEFRWTEHGLLEPPRQTGTGFGTQVVQSSVPYLLGGSSNVSFHEGSVECIVETAVPKEYLAVGRASRA